MNKTKGILLIAIVAIALIVKFCNGQSNLDFSKRHQLEIKNDKKENQNYNKAPQLNQNIPPKVIEVLRYVRLHQEPPSGYVGGEKFFNREKRLPIFDKKNQKINYTKWDVNPKIKGENRGAERLITSDKKAYYTPDHYETFIEIIE